MRLSAFASSVGRKTLTVIEILSRFEVLVENKQKDNNTFFKKNYETECNIACNHLLDKFSVIAHAHYLPQLKPKGLNV